MTSPSLTASTDPVKSPMKDVGRNAPKFRISQAIRNPRASEAKVLWSPPIFLDSAKTRITAMNSRAMAMGSRNVIRRVGAEKAVISSLLSRAPVEIREPMPITKPKIMQMIINRMAKRVLEEVIASHLERYRVL